MLKACDLDLYTVYPLARDMAAIKAAPNAKKRATPTPERYNSAPVRTQSRPNKNGRFYARSNR